MVSWLPSDTCSVSFPILLCYFLVSDSFHIVHPTRLYVFTVFLLELSSPLYGFSLFISFLFFFMLVLSDPAYPEVERAVS